LTVKENDIIYGIEILCTLIQFKNIPGQVADVVSWLLPAHGAPPFSGVGLSHCLVRFFIPLESQEAQFPQVLHPPLTKKNHYQLIKDINKNY
jgi:hypothetical protein